MVIGFGDRGDAVKRFQRGLNRLGSMLLVDGEFGPGTRDAVVDARVVLGKPGPTEADEVFQEAVAAVPELFPPLTGAGLTFIARAEVSSPAAYRRTFQSPCWPSEQSGITIGIGYDCQFITAQQFEADWKDVLATDMMARLAPVFGKVGSAALLSGAQDVTIPLPAAMRVFATRSLPQYLDQARSIYPTIDGLPPAQRTALVSLVYNRGTRLADKSDGREDRREIRAIRDLLATNDRVRIASVADQFESMTRLWDPVKTAGLIQRRRDEATLWRQGFAALQLD